MSDEALEHRVRLVVAVELAELELRLVFAQGQGIDAALEVDGVVGVGPGDPRSGVVLRRLRGRVADHGLAGGQVAHEGARDLGQGVAGGGDLAIAQDALEGDVTELLKLLSMGGGRCRGARLEDGGGGRQRHGISLVTIPSSDECTAPATVAASA